MEESNIIENVTKSIAVRLRIPIIATYVSVLLIYNWDILFYLFFEKISASDKIEVIKNTYSESYLDRILTCLGIAIVVILIFTVINTLLNFTLKWFYRKDKELKTEINDHEKVKVLTEQLSESIDQNKLLISEIESLKNINQNLSVKKLKFETSDISQKDYDNLIIYLTSTDKKEKYLFCLKELINILKKNINIPRERLLTRESVTYLDEMKELIGILDKRNLARFEYLYRDGVGHDYFLDLSKSFKDFLKMEI